MSDKVEWMRTLRVKVLLRTPEVDGPRGWAEGALTYIDIVQDNDELLFQFSRNGETYRFSREVIEAIYDLHQDVPR